MIYITGDTHIPADIQKLSTKHFPQQKELTKNDYVIICGDFGGVWDGSKEEKYWIKWLKSKNFTTLFVDGNHENFDMLYQLPIIEFGGSVVHKAEDGIYHLIRGNSYTIDKKTFFVFGGAQSHDKECRIEGKNWWKEEMPCEQEYHNAGKTLRQNDFKFDFVITHSAPTSVQSEIAPTYGANSLTEFFEKLKDVLVYKKWFFGHYHKDIETDERFTAVFNRFYQI